MALRNDLIEILEDDGVGTYEVDIFVGRKARIPTGDGPYWSIILTGGYAPDYIQNDADPAYQHPGAQFTCRAKDPIEAETGARMAYKAVAKVTNLVVSGGVRYLRIRPIQEPFDLGDDDAGRSRWSFNVTVEKTPSVA